MTNEPTQTAIHGASGDTCGSCGAALNFDQRYCLACGTRRAGTGLHFQQMVQGVGIDQQHTEILGCQYHRIDTLLRK
jgi:hypothetical protein